jgi:hypothetical protein
MEPVIGHLKSDNHTTKNYLTGPACDMINTIMVTAASKMMKRLRQIRYVIYFPEFTDQVLAPSICNCMELFRVD